MPTIRIIFAYLLTFLVATGITYLTTLYQHPANEIAQYGNLCTVENWMHCYQPRLSAGFPFAFYFDNPGVSIEQQIGFIPMEDEFRLTPFLIDIWIYFLLLIVSYKALFNRL